MTEDTENPALAADAEQHARQEVAGLRYRVLRRGRDSAGPLAAAGGVLVSAWLLRRRIRRR